MSGFARQLSSLLSCSYSSALACLAHVFHEVRLFPSSQLLQAQLQCPALLFFLPLIHNPLPIRNSNPAAGVADETKQRHGLEPASLQLPPPAPPYPRRPTPHEAAAAAASAGKTHRALVAATSSPPAPLPAPLRCHSRILLVGAAPRCRRKCTTPSFPIAPHSYVRVVLIFPEPCSGGVRWPGGAGGSPATPLLRRCRRGRWLSWSKCPWRRLGKGSRSASCCAGSSAR
jgi:hypothetical protein